MIALLAFLPLGCAASPRKSQAPVSPPFVGKVIVHKRTVNFLDIEAPVEDFWAGCSSIDRKADIAFLSFYVADTEKSWEFIYRRPRGVAQCLAEEKEYREMIRGAKTIRIVGINHSEEGSEPPDPPIPGRFTSVPKRTVSIFIRLQADNRCKAYFSNHCDLPKEYWANTIPQ